MDAWKQLVERFARLIWAIARSHGLSVADADDVTQTTWLRLAEHLGRLRDPARVDLWLAKTARNESLRTLRCAGRSIPFDPWANLTLETGSPELDSDLLAGERNRAMWRAFERLTPTCRVLLLMLTSDKGRSYAEVSSSLGIPIGSIGPTRSRCLKCLRNSSELRAFLSERTFETQRTKAE